MRKWSIVSILVVSLLLPVAFGTCLWVIFERPFERSMERPMNPRCVQCGQFFDYSGDCCNPECLACTDPPPPPSPAEQRELLRVEWCDRDGNVFRMQEIESTRTEPVFCGECGKHLTPRSPVDGSRYCYNEKCEMFEVTLTPNGQEELE